jgi:penicillin-binding protein 1A
MGKQPPRGRGKSDDGSGQDNKPPFSSDQMKQYFSDAGYRQQMYRQSKNLFRKYWYITAIIGAAFVFLMTLYTQYIFAGLPSLEQLENPKPELATKVYSIDGEVLDEFYLKNRTYISLNEIPPDIVQALISTEDKEFYSDWGVEPWRFMRAMVKNIISFQLKEGASTITQQLARNLYNLKGARETLFDKITRKIQEFITSVQIERTYTKKEILEMYFNWIYLGHGAYGISAASSIYFDKPASQLTLAEGSLLVGMAKGPGYYDPFKHPTRAFARRDIVLQQMVNDGKITQAEADSAHADHLKFSTTDETSPHGIAPAFVEYVRQQLLQMSEKYGFDIYKDGLSVYTTLDSRMQRYANMAVEEQLAQVQASFDKTWDWSKHLDILNQAIAKSLSDNPDYQKAASTRQRDSIATALRNNSAFVDSVKKSWQTVQVGFVVIDPHTGGIRAMVGGVNFKDYKYGLNHVTQIRRQPGSAFKPFVYTVAIDNGYPPTYELPNQPVTLVMEDGTRWTPSNSDGTVGGMYTLREALRESINLIAVRAIMDIAPKQQVIDYAHRMGITTPIPPFESIALGTAMVTPLDMTSAYGVFANEGVYVQPNSILRIEDKDGNLIEESSPEKREVLSKETAYIMTSMLEDVINRGTGTRVREFFHYPAAGKTGTTQDYADAWFIGYTPELSAGVWIGFDNQQVKFTNWDGQGGRTAAPLWGRFMQYVYSDNSIPITQEDFQMPDGVVIDTICSETKKLATPYCPKTETEVFNIKYQPGRCDKHTSPMYKENEDPNRIQF